MADITLCTNQTCPLRSNCKRGAASAEPMQSYQHFEYRLVAGVVPHCAHEKPIKGEGFWDRFFGTRAKRKGMHYKRLKLKQ
jgi:hypothetical protein